MWSNLVACFGFNECSLSLAAMVCLVFVLAPEFFALVGVLSRVCLEFFNKVIVICHWFILVLCLLLCVCVVITRVIF